MCSVIYLYYLIFDVMLMMFILLPLCLNNFHPLILSLVLIIYTLILSIKLNYLNNSYWYSYVIYLIVIGGIMIMFLYLTSIANNEMFKVSLKIYLIYLIMLMVMLMIYMILIKFSGIFNFMIIYNSSEFYSMVLNNEILLEYKNLYMKFSMGVNIYLIFYLFFTMVSCVLICLKESLPLRQMN
uniref:NADH dehydrogenase subunit 6 n=1 Tax=Afrocampsis griseosetosus TaxID=1491719 RepID=A0A0U1WEI6_9HYME|nr:NADH dehydrogenase subunit 6 [Afrocampsis griseosetosus]